MKRIIGISGGFPMPGPRDSIGLPIGSLADETGWIVAFPPWSEIIANEDNPVELEVSGYDENWNPEKDSDGMVKVTLWRCKDGTRFSRLYEQFARRSSLKECPALIVRS